MQDYYLINYALRISDAIDTVVIVEIIPRTTVELSKNPLLIKFEVEEDTKYRCNREWEEWLKNDNAGPVQGFPRQV